MKGWRTLAFNAAFALLAVAEAADWVNLLGAETSVYVLMGVNVANMVLRAMTTSPVGKA